ncbi:MAG: type II toxin-antitoxin system HigB family toxin [Gemmataceae bacterium]|nr:type II toxin-antitoxin system HigB family toxin [Gemmataceae bacterium]
MRVISKRRPREFWESRKGNAQIAERDLSTWYKLAKNSSWASFAELKQTFGSADRVGNCIVFDVGNNRFRLIGRVNFRKGILYVLRVMDHAEYDKNTWPDECGCWKPPPKLSVAPSTSGTADKPIRLRRLR